MSQEKTQRFDFNQLNEALEKSEPSIAKTESSVQAVEVRAELFDSRFFSTPPLEEVFLKQPAFRGSPVYTPGPIFITSPKNADLDSENHLVLSKFLGPGGIDPVILSDTPIHCTKITDLVSGLLQKPDLSLTHRPIDNGIVDYE